MAVRKEYLNLLELVKLLADVFVVQLVCSLVARGDCIKTGRAALAEG